MFDTETDLILRGDLSKKMKQNMEANSKSWYSGSLYYEVYIVEV